jgi:hypothetical protein
MATAKEQLLKMMSPNQARLLDQQMRDQQVAQRSQGAGMLSGLVQAYTGMSDIAQRAGGIMPMGAYEAQAIKQQKILDETTKQESLISNAARVAIKSSDVNELQKERDNLLSEGSQAAVSLAQKIQNKIDGLNKTRQQMGVIEGKVETALDIVAKSNLPEEIKYQIDEEISSGITKPEDVNKRIKEANDVVVKGNKVQSGIEALSSLGLSQEDKVKYTKYLQAGGSITTLFQEFLPNQENLSVDRLSQMYRFFTSESVEKFKDAFRDGKRGADLPALEEQNSERKVNVASVSKSMRMDFESLVNEYFDDPNVKAVFTDAGIFIEDPDSEKIRAYVADVYTYANRNQILPSEALLRWSAEKNREVSEKGGASSDIDFSSVTEDDISKFTVEQLDAYIEYMQSNPTPN